MSRSRTSAFTLIEVLASMAVLLLITLALSRLFAEATRSYTRATTTATRAGAIRAAMEMITTDLEGLAVDRRLAMHKEANVSFDDFDIICFSTVSGPRDYQATLTLNADRAHSQVAYMVTNYDGKGYSTFVLKRFARKYEVSRNRGIDSLGAQREWWNFRKYPGAVLESVDGGYDEAHIAENVVRFDVWTCGRVSDNLQDDSVGTVVWGNYQPFDSMYAYDHHPSNTPPTHLDVLLQIASDDAMKKAAALLKGSQGLGKGSDEGKRLYAAAYAILYQDSTILIGRVTPVMGIGQWMHPLPY